MIIKHKYSLGQNPRWNANPSPDNQLPETGESKLKGQFIIDKNINRGEREPTSLLLPSGNYFYTGEKDDRPMGGAGFNSNSGNNKITINNPRFAEKASYVTLKQSEYKGDQAKEIDFLKRLNPNFPAGESSLQQS